MLTTRTNYLRGLWRLGVVLALLAVNLPAGRPAQAAPAGWRSLTGRLPPNAVFGNVTFSPDSQYTVFLFSPDVADGLVELYSAPLTGGAMVKLNPPLVDGGIVIGPVAITPDSAFVVYLADQDVDDQLELYRVPIAGGPSVKLNGPLVAGGNVSAFLVDAGTQRVVYRADQAANDIDELFSVPLFGGAVVKLSPTPVSGGDVTTFAIDPEGNRVVYRADQDTNDLMELYSVPITGGGAVKLNQPLAASVNSFAIAPGQAYVVFTAQAQGGSANELFANFTNPGGPPLKRNLPLAAGERVGAFKVSPDGEQIVYNVCSGACLGKLYLADQLVGASRLISEMPVTGSGVNGFYFTPDSRRVVYAYRQISSEPFRLQSVDVAGGPLDRQNLFIPDAGTSLGPYQISPDSQWVMFRYLSGLNAIPTAGGFLGTLCYINCGGEQVMPDSSRVVFTLFEPGSITSDLFSLEIPGGGLRNLSHSRLSEYAHSPLVSPNGQWIVYTVSYDDNSRELRVSDGAEGQVVFEVFLPHVGR